MKNVYIYLNDNVKWHGTDDKCVTYSEDYNLVIFNKPIEIQYEKGWVVILYYDRFMIKENIDLKDINKIVIN